MAYMAPGASKAEVERVLRRVQATQRGKATLMGDLKAMHISWNNVTNRRGTVLTEWAKRSGWEIRGAGCLTCHSNGSESNPDLFVSKGVRMHDVQIYHGQWSGCSDHEAIKAEVQIAAERREARRQIPRGRRKEEKYIEKARASLKHQLPMCREEMKR